ncbi:peptidase domain-containing ABC transporter [Micromonospora cathayae]|uniref:Peptidase domain-containing ABC transporter n=1 Tax=Micromonospora cathayae TaxID=3028804 RepID=A0ABY7ZLB9_9ACTN|nr:peptidase domain-containing ABC transporter [Micromonospora sp. HUAS 3]WDZ83700.1 peptidase domain-containing ABC transporter [Micromonospora sp. HUAS 3]
MVLAAPGPDDPGPVIRRRRRVPVVLQVAATDCGPSALAMLLAASGRAVPVSQLRARLDVGRDGLSLRELRDAAQEHGLRCRAIALPALRQDATRLRELAMPLVAHWNGDHYVVVERAHRRGIDVVDPAVGRRRLSPAQFAAGTTGVVLLAEPAGPAPPAVPGPAPVRDLLVPVLRRHTGLLTLLTAASALLTVTGLAVPWATAAIIDATAPPSTSWLVAVAALAVVTGALSLARGLTVTALQRRIGTRLGTDTVRRLFEVVYRYFHRRSAGDLVDRVRAVGGVRDLLASSLVATALDALLVVGYLTVVTVLAPVLGLVAAAVIAVQAGTALWVGRRSGALHREELLASGEEAARLADAVQGMAAIRVAGAQQRVLRRWQESFERGVEAAYRLARLSAASDAFLAAWSMASPVLMLLVAARHADSPGRAAGLAALAVAAITPAVALAQRLPSFTLLAPTVDRLADIADAPVEQPTPGRPAPPLTGLVTLTGVGFRYDRRSPWALRGVTAVIRPGAKVAVVGGSGSGKSTLVGLLTGLYPPTEGRIHLDGLDLATLDLSSVRRQIGVVLQEPYVGAGTLREALTLSRPDASDAAIARAIRLAALDDDVAALPMGLQTRIGDGGAGLSGGQRQRVALARALLAEPVLLILDEATSALDTVTEAAVEAGLRTLPVTRVVIAHRLSTVADADLVLVLDGGRPVEYGPPDVLLAAGGPFARLAGVSAGPVRPGPPARP